MTAFGALETNGAGAGDRDETAHGPGKRAVSAHSARRSRAARNSPPGWPDERIGTTRSFPHDRTAQPDPAEPADALSAGRKNRFRSLDFAGIAGLPAISRPPVGTLVALHRCPESFPGD